jgi:stage II sporulation protein AA (anti-sigma F factor antagonist)
MIPLARRTSILDAESQLYTRDVVSLQISTRVSGDVTILDLRGRSTIDGGETEMLSKQLQKLVANDVRHLLLNLSGLTQMDSSGVSVIVETYLALKRQNGDLRLLRPSGRVREVLTLFHLLGEIPSFEDEAEALASFRPRGYYATS